MEEEKQPTITEEMIREAQDFWNNPQNIINLIDILFLFDEDRKTIPS